VRIIIDDAGVVSWKILHISQKCVIHMRENKGSRGSKCSPTKLLGSKSYILLPSLFCTFSNIVGDITCIGKSSMLPLGHPVLQFHISFPEKLLKIVATRGEIFLA